MVKAIWASLSGALQARIGHIYDNFIIKKISPPDNSSFIGDGDFEQIGQEFLSFFIKFGNLQPTDKVLDVGCGIGRMALPLTQYLNRKGQYVGFDIIPTGVDWCRAHINSKFPNFIFRLADVYNENYIIDLYAKYKLDILKPLQYGFWCGRKDHLTYQDVIIAERSRG